MNSNQQVPTCEEAKQLDMVDYLSTLGFQPAKIIHGDYWYNSPFHDENTPSFKVNRSLNRWYDHSEGKGGNLVDFGTLYHRCTVKELLQKLAGQVNTPERKEGSKKAASATDDGNSRIKIIAARSIQSLPLIRYLNKRRIPLTIAGNFCKEVSYELYNKNYFAIGFKNDAGGYELRNEYFKGSSSPKDITILSNQAHQVQVFEGFFNFLSYQTIHQQQPQPKTDFLILNSVSHFEKARPFMEQYEAIRLYLDRDTTGQNYTQNALALSKRYQDESHLYKGHKDLNEWIMHIGQAQKKGQQQSR